MFLYVISDSPIASVTLRMTMYLNFADNFPFMNEYSVRISVICVRRSFKMFPKNPPSLCMYWRSSPQDCCCNCAEVELNDRWLTSHAQGSGVKL